MRRLKDALRETARKVEQKKKLAGNKRLAEANKAALVLFESKEPIYRRIRPNEPPQNITLIALLRVNRYMRRKGLNWRRMDWDTILQWLYDNWEKILRVILSLLPLILI